MLWRWGVRTFVVEGLSGEDVNAAVFYAEGGVCGCEGVAGW